MNVISFIKRALQGTSGGAVQVADDQPLPVADGKEKPLLQTQIASLSSVAGLPSVPATAMRAYLQASGQNVRYCDDGTNPTSTTGLQLYVGQLVVYSGDLSAIKFIEAAPGAKLDVAYYA